MGVFSGLEGSLEKYIEGFFKDSFNGSIQPVEIARKLAREMRDCRRVSVKNIYVPNEYTVCLHPSDYENVSNFASMLSQELQEYITKKADEKRYTLAGPPAVKFIPDENLAAGKIKMKSVFNEALLTETQSGMFKEHIEHTQPFLPVKESIKTDTVPLIYGRLLVEEGPDKGKKYDLTAVSLTLGRRKDCDIVFNDSSISRRHARLELHRGVYTITDLGSTNGTRINGIKINSKLLEPGDVISLGTTTCLLKVE